ncbi:ArsR/SmtB family transcription factor [Oceanirhabdus sp. W0125-5]|uniref:ArsR/SmtB family transcription factor n=1 Tax=Oceanirhabdus sp. W0125-5 TaxID=2999116 RepID=UPI0022F2C6BE|nr:ArsR family transcriptional regulator [Oceanirhabdus sp. W0125-5]WBW96681.1 ArsR family transcriptional regulator [Oceanirhabdus sp. W0125-5]
MAIIVDYKNIEIDNLIMSLSMGANLQDTYDLYAQYGLTIDKDVKKLLKHIDVNKKIDRIMLNKLFKNYSTKGRDTTLFHYVFSWRQWSIGKDLDEFLNYLENIDENKILNKIYYKLLRFYKDKEHVEINDNEVKIEEVIELLLKLELNTDFKWGILEVCWDVKGFFIKCSEFLRETRKILENKLQFFDEKGRQWGKELKNRIDNEGFKIIKSVLDDFSEEEYNNIFVSPRIIDSYAIDWNHINNGEEIYFYIGENFEFLNDKFGLESDKKWVQTVLKNLSESSRLQIMTLLKEKPRYGVELAEKLQLTNATVTHHSTILNFIKLIDDTRIDNRTYFKIRKSSIDKFIDIFMSEFNIQQLEKDVYETLIQEEDIENTFLNILKCISDSSRYDLLKLISEKEMYGGELAQAMSLSVGSISYHTSSLISCGLISKKRVSGRVYYETNKENLIKWIMMFEDRFR